MAGRDKDGGRRRRRHGLSVSQLETLSASDPYHSNSRSSRKVTEEEIQEYLAKKATNKALRSAKKLKVDSVSGYSNDLNPFGDSNLGEKFVWRKKIERDVAQGVPVDEFSVKAERKRHGERMMEIETVKKRREERAIEKARHEEEMALLARERARAEFQEWEKKEEAFDFEQSMIRSRIRLHEGRAKPIDILRNYLVGFHELDIELSQPYMVFKGLTVKEMEEIRGDIKMNLDLDRVNVYVNPIHVRYWEALMVVCDWEIAEAREREASNRARFRGEEALIEQGLRACVKADVQRLLDGKTLAQLEKLHSDIQSRLRSGSAKVVEYWEALEKLLQLYKAKACLNELHAQMLRKHLRCNKLSCIDREKSKQGIEFVEAFFRERVSGEEEARVPEAGSCSPELLHSDDYEEAIDPDDDKKALEQRRMAVLEEQQKRIKEATVASKPETAENNLEITAMKAMEEMEEGDALSHFDAKVILDSQAYWWHDKYRPRKPKYYNCVHTGYDWNNYNRMHFDHDNPPPKMVKGYKFNIFYPDLIDKTKTPTYTIVKDGDSIETCIIRFQAGPPYEDIAFRIVNKDWVYSRRNMFKCTFEHETLHLHFNFKRYRFRR